MQIERRELDYFKHAILDRTILGETAKEILWYPKVYNCIPRIYVQLRDLWVNSASPLMKVSGTYLSDVKIDFCRHVLPEGLLGLAPQTGNWVVIGNWPYFHSPDSSFKPLFPPDKYLEPCLNLPKVSSGEKKALKLPSSLSMTYDCLPLFSPLPEDFQTASSLYKTTIFDESPNDLHTTMALLNNLFLYKYDKIVYWLSSSIKAKTKTKTMLLNAYKQMSEVVRQAYNLVEKVRSENLTSLSLDFLGLQPLPSIPLVSLSKYDTVRETFDSAILLFQEEVSVVLTTSYSQQTFTLFNCKGNTLSNMSNLAILSPHIMAAIYEELDSLYLALSPIIGPVEEMNATIEQMEEKFDTLRSL